MFLLSTKFSILDYSTNLPIKGKETNRKGNELSSWDQREYKNMEAFLRDSKILRWI